MRYRWLGALLLGALTCGCVTRGRYREAEHRAKLLRDELDGIKSAKERVDKALVLERERSESLLKQVKGERAKAAAEVAKVNDRFSGRVKQLETQLGVATRTSESLGGRMKEREAEMQALIEAERAKALAARRDVAKMKEQVRQQTLLLGQMKQGLNRTVQEVQDLREKVSVWKAAAQTARAKMQTAQAAWAEEKDGLVARHGQDLQSLAKQRDTARQAADRLFARRLATIGIFQKQNGELKKALATFRKALERDPENKQARRGLDLVLKELPASPPPEEGAPEETPPAPDKAAPDESAPPADTAQPEETPEPPEKDPPEEAPPPPAKGVPEETPAAGGEAAS
jgi:tetratricopeptide (TPR) repeat protein